MTLCCCLLLYLLQRDQWYGTIKKMIAGKRSQLSIPRVPNATRQCLSDHLTRPLRLRNRGRYVDATWMTQVNHVNRRGPHHDHDHDVIL